MPGVVALLERHARPVREVRIAGAIDERAAPDGTPPRLGLDEERIDLARFAPPRLHPQSMEQHLHAPRAQQRIGGALERRHVVGLRVDAPEDEVRLREAVQRAHAMEQLVREAVHDLADLAMDVRVQPAEIGDARRGPHAAQEPVALDEDHARAVRGRRGRRGDARRPAAQHDDIPLRDDRDRARGLDHARQGINPA